MMANPVTGKIGVPGLETPLVDLTTGNVFPQGWYRFFTYLWQVASGQGQAVPSKSVLLQQTAVAGTLVVTDATTGTVLGHIILSP